MSNRVPLTKCEKCNKFYDPSKKHICKKKDIHKQLMKERACNEKK